MTYPPADPPQEPGGPEPAGPGAAPEGDNPWAASEAAAAAESGAPPVSDLEPHRGTAVLVLGITGLVLTFCGCPLLAVLGLVAWVMGHRDLRAMREGYMDPTGRDTTLAGYICGIIATVLGSLWLIVMILYFALVAVVAVSNA